MASNIQYPENSCVWFIEGDNFVINGFIDKKAFYKNKIDIYESIN